MNGLLAIPLVLIGGTDLAMILKRILDGGWNCHPAITMQDRPSSSSPERSGRD